MKRTIFYITISFLVFCCKSGGFKNENGVVFDSEKIVGRYKLDVVEAVKETSSSSDKIYNGLAAEILGNSVSLEINFYKNGKGLMHFDMGWLGSLTNKKDENIEFKYSLRNDSTLVINDKELTIKTFSDNFDYLLLVEKTSKSKYIFNKTIK